MSAPKRVLVTGATGFLGSHLAYRLLEKGHHVTALARSSKAGSARDRVLEVMEQAPESPDEFREHIARLTVVEGDIAQPNLGLTSETSNEAPPIDEVWHCAASLSFTDENRDEIFRMNVGGTENVLAYAARLPSKRIHHVSTAYVAGVQPVAYESKIDVGQQFRNAYEESKCKAEIIVDRAHQRGDVSASVYRPSIVIGDSRSGRVTHFHGVYAFIRGLFSAVQRLKRKTSASGPVYLPFRVPGSETTTLNFVPIEYVVDGMIEIGSRPTSPGNTYHLTNPEATPNNFWLPAICRIIGVEGIRIVPESIFEQEPPTKLEALFQKQMAFYYMYLKGEPEFDCRQTLGALRDTGIACPRVTMEVIERMVGWYIDYLRRESQPLKRQESKSVIESLETPGLLDSHE